MSNKFFLSFNIWAFLFGPLWFCYHKMIEMSIIISIIYVIISWMFYFSPLCPIYDSFCFLPYIGFNFVMAFFANWIYIRHIEKRSYKLEYKKMTSLGYLFLGVLIIFGLELLRTGGLVLIEKTTRYKTNQMYSIAMKEDSARSIYILKELAKKNQNIIEEKNASGETLAFIAAKNNHLNKLKYFSEIGANLEAQSNMGIRPIHAAALLGHERIVEFLISKGVDINVERADCTPLMLAASGNHVDVMKLLIKHGANINYVAKKSGYAATALDIAMLEGKVEAADYLIKCGAKKAEFAKLS